MKSISDYQNDIAQVMGVPWQNNQLRISLTVEDAADAKVKLAEVRLQQKELRQIKRDIAQDEKEIRLEYKLRAGQVTPGLGTMLFLGKGAANRGAADKKRALNQQMNRQVAPYEEAKRVIDNLLVQLDRFKLKLDQFIQENK